LLASDESVAGEGRRVLAAVARARVSTIWALVGAVDSRVSAAWRVRVADVAGDGSGDVVGAITVVEVSISVAGGVFSDAAEATG
jgi:hypothetical protein